MKRILAGFLCFSVILGALTGCGGAKAVDVVKASSAQVEISQTQRTASQNAGTVKTETDSRETLLPISPDPDADIEKGLHIAVVAKSTEGSYWKQMRKYMKEAVDYINRFYGLKGEDSVQVTFEGPDSDAKVDDQINTIDAVLAENPSVLCLAAIDRNSCQAQIETARDNGIPVVLFDSKVKSDMDTAFCATDNYLAGAEAAKRLCAAIRQTGKTRKVAVFTHASYDQASRSRTKGFLEELSENHADVKALKYMQDQEEDIEDTFRRILEKGRVDGIFCTSQALAEKALAVMKEYPDREIALVGFDAGKIQIEAIQEGRELGTIIQNIPLIACRTIQSAIDAASPGQAETSEKNMKIDYFWADSQSLEEAAYEGLLYE